MPPDPAAPVAEDEAPAFLPLAVSGSFWSRYELRSGYDDHGLRHPRLHREGDYIVSRARIGFMTNPVDVGSGVRVSAKIAPQATYTMGDSPGAAPTVSDHPALALYEGFARVATNDYALDAGRFMLDYGDALVIGNLDWNEAARAFNGARVHLTPNASKYYVDVLATLVEEGRLLSAEPVSGDTYFYGVYAGIGPYVAEGLDLDVYALAQTVAATDGFVLADPTDPAATVAGDREGATQLTLGARVKGTASVVDYRAEAGLQVGQTPVAPTFAAPTTSAQDKLAFQIDGEVGVSPVKPFRVGLEGLYASGDDRSTPGKNEGYDQLYPTAHKFLGLMDVTGARTNVASGVLHLKYAVADPVTLLLDGHYFARPRPGPDGQAGALGGEVDAQVKYVVGGGFVVRGLYAVFLPSKEFWTPKSDSADDAGTPLQYVEAQVGYDFK